MATRIRDPEGKVAWYDSGKFGLTGAATGADARGGAGTIQGVAGGAGTDTVRGGVLRRAEQQRIISPNPS